MKKKKIAILISAPVFFATSCVKNLLDRPHTTEISSDLFWETVDDATLALHGVYNAARTLFTKNYAWDGASDIMYASVTVPFGRYQPVANMGEAYDQHWKNAYQLINRTNYVQEHVEQMLIQYPEEIIRDGLKRVIAELYFLRALAYFRLTDLWGDVPYYTHQLNGNEEAYSLHQTPRDEILANILEELDYAVTVLPVSVSSGENGRATLAAAYGFRGKIKLYWACWKKHEGDLQQADLLYREAAGDFREVMKPEYGLGLYMDGDPGEPDAPYYLDLFDGQHNYNPEVIFVIGNAGPSLGVGDTFVYDFGTRSTGNGGTNVTPIIRLANRYQLLTTGDYAPELITGNDPTLPGGACNPDSYLGRDYRMWATLVWDGQQMLEMSVDGKTAGPNILTYKYGEWGTGYINAQGPGRAGYIFRKYVRQYVWGDREGGQQDQYLMRLPDLWLMYCEAVNEYNGGPTDELFDLVDKIRARGALPGLDRTKFNTKEAFFNAIDQERAVELVAEGHRFFDLRRWRMVEQTWPQPDGYRLTCTHGESAWIFDQFRNASDRDIQRFYIFRIPPGEVEMNPNLKQNEPWL